MQMLVDTWWWWWWPPAALRRTVRRLHRLVPPGSEGAPTYESTWTPTKWRRRQARVADEARDLAGTPRLLLGRAVARDEVDDGTARCRHDA